MSKRAASPIPPSLAMPHGDPIPAETQERLIVGRAHKRRRGDPPRVDVLSQGRGAYSSLGYTTTGYRAARVAEREGRSPSRTGAVVHERIDRLKLQYQSRDFVRNNGLYGGIITRTRNYIIGEGFKLNCKSKSETWNRKVEKAWEDWWITGTPEIKQTLNGPLVEKLILDEVLTCGDTGVVLTDVKHEDDDQIQIVEAEQIIGHDWLKQGIDKDSLMRPIKYWVSPYDPYSGVPIRSECKGYSPDTFLHICALARASSYRPVPPFQSGFPMMHRINDICDAESLARQMQARVAMTSNRISGLPVPAQLGEGSPILDQSEDFDDTADGAASLGYVTELDTALIFHGQPGDRLEGVERTAPGGDFSDTIRMFLRLLGLPMGIPLELILLDWTGGNYSQSKAVLEQAYQTFLEWQQLLEFRFYRRLFKWWLKGMIERGRIRNRSDAFEHTWIKNTFPWLDQLQEAEAQGIKVDRGFGTYGDVLRSLNKDERVRDERANEIEWAIKKAKEIEGRNKWEPGTMPWESLCGMAPPKRATETINPKTDAKGETSKPGQKKDSVPAKKINKPDSPRESFVPVNGVAHASV
jgi:capsid protein